LEYTKDEARDVEKLIKEAIRVKREEYETYERILVANMKTHKKTYKNLDYSEKCKS